MTARGVAGGRTAALIIKARGGFKVAGKPDSPEVARVREQSMITARAVLAKRGIKWERGA